MSKSALIACALIASVSGAQAQSFVEKPHSAARGGPSLTLALEALQTTLAACQAKNFPVSALVIDFQGATIALLSADGASFRTPELAYAKAATALKYKAPSGEIMKRADTDKALAAELQADPKIGSAHQGGLPIMAGGKVIGAIAASGAIGGENDEACAKIGLDKIAARVK